MSRATLYRILALLSILVLSATAREFGYFHDANNFITERRMEKQLHAASGKIALLEIDHKSLTAVGLWPWKRSIYGGIIKKAFEAGAEEVVFDIDFSSHSDEQEDRAFAKAMESAAGPVTLAVFQQYATSDTSDLELQTNMPITPLSNQAWLATVNVIADSDGYVRSFPLAQDLDGEWVPSLTSVLGGVENVVPSSFLINYNIDPDSIPTFSIIDLLRDDLPADALKGRKVLVGAGAAELRDTMAVPVFGMMSGPKLQIVAAENLIQGNSLSYAPASWLHSISAAIFLPIFLIIYNNRINTLVRISCLIGLALAVEALGYWLYVEQNRILETAMIQIWLVTSGFIAIISEISFKSLMLRLSHKHNESLSDLLETIVNDSLSGILIADEKGTILGISGQAKSMLTQLGYQPDKGDPMQDKIPPEFENRIKDCLTQPRNNPDDQTLEIIEISRDNETRYHEFSITPSTIMQHVKNRQAAIRVATLLFNDVTDARREQVRLEYLADHDPITDQLNLPGFCNAVDDYRHASTEENVTILCCQLKRLDRISHSLGRDHRDALLRHVGRRLEDSGLFDGIGLTDEKRFLLCKRNCNPDDLNRLTDAVLEIFEMPCDVRGHNVIIGGQIGIADFSHDFVATADVTRAASVALERCLDTDGEILRYSSDLATEFIHQQTLEQQIVGALQTDEFELYYQPQVDMRSGEVIGAEALIRWQHPEFGTIRPDLFIPILEETGKIVDLGRWILNTACKEAMSWPKPITVAVNISAVQVQRSDLLADIDEALKASGLPIERLQIEITESMFIADTNLVIEKLNAIRDIGIQIALDDFGTGYSALSYIHQFPLDKIKIDRSFVKDLPHSMDSIAVINAVVALARGLDMKIIAEGMETAAQADALRIAGCHYAQGYFYGKPMPCAQFVQHLSIARAIANG